MDNKSNNECKNNYSSKSEYIKKHGNDESIKKCSSCQFFNYEDGLITCKKFN